MKKVMLLGTFIIASAFSCSVKNDMTSSFRVDAKKYCEVHGIAYWQKDNKLESLNTLNGMEKQAELIRVIRSAVDTPEMQKVIFDEGGKLPAEDFYLFLQRELPKLTTQPFDCPAIPKFYISQ
jgi:hypothetical protein